MSGYDYGWDDDEEAVAEVAAAAPCVCSYDNGPCLLHGPRPPRYAPYGQNGRNPLYRAWVLLTLWRYRRGWRWWACGDAMSKPIPLRRRWWARRMLALGNPDLRWRAWRRRRKFTRQQRAVERSIECGQ